MNKKKILGVILLSILFVLAGCSKNLLSDIKRVELSEIERLEGVYNTDLGLLKIKQDKQVEGLGGFGLIQFDEDVKKFDENKLHGFFGEATYNIELKDEAVFSIVTIKGTKAYKSIYHIKWDDKDKTKKIDNVTITKSLIEESDGEQKYVNETYLGLRVKDE